MIDIILLIFLSILQLSTGGLKSWVLSGGE